MKQPRGSSPDRTATEPPIDSILERTLQFFQDNTPSWSEILRFGPPGLILSFLFLTVSGGLKRTRNWRTGYTRKLFHILTFLTAAMLQWWGGVKHVCLFGGMTSLVLLFAVLRGDGHLLYEAVAREKDAPRRTHYIVTPYLATLLGGLAGNVLFGPLAMFGYLVTGLGDAVGEPVGTRFGRHPYRVPSLTKVKAIRTLEGSAAVGIMSLLSLVVGVTLVGAVPGSLTVLLWLPVVAAVCMLVEAVSPHGWDNLTLQLTPTLLMWLAI